MGSFTLVVAAALILAVSFTHAERQCPQPGKVYSRGPKCKDNSYCTGGKLCCLNQSNEKTCCEPVYHGGTGSDKYGPGTGGVLCEGVRCQIGEVCEFDKNTKRKKCVRK